MASAALTNARTWMCGPESDPWMAACRSFRSQPDVGETVMPGAMVLATFAETKVARSPGRRAEKDMDVVLRPALRQVFPSPCQVLTHLASLSRKRERGQLQSPFTFSISAPRAEHPLTWTRVSTPS